MIKINRRWAVVVHDLVMISVAWQFAWLARFNFRIPSRQFWEANLEALPWVLLIQGGLAWYFGLYRGLWRFASLKDLWNIVRAVLIGVLAISMVLFVVNRLEDVPRSLLILYPLFLLVLWGGPRLAYRVWKDHRLNLGPLSEQQRVLVVGAGRGGEGIVRDMLRDGRCVPVGLLDDQKRLTNTRIHDVPVLGTLEDLPGVVEQHSVDSIFIAIPSATNAEMQRIVRLCEQTGRPFRTLPRLQDLVSGQAGLQALREVSIDDLLGRDTVKLDRAAIQRGLSGRRVLVSGGGGSIGRELCRQVARLLPHSLVVFESNEFNLYRAESLLRREFPDLQLHALLGDVCDPGAVDRVLGLHRPEVIFHAAAYKHVPILESQAREALHNNLLGTHVLGEAACRHGCGKFVLISTDKAVNPGSVMGASKRAAEILCEHLNRRGPTRFITVRFGNVLESDGSVVPLFRDQIKAGGPVTVTHPEVSRYFMTIPEACQLILQSGAMGEGGEIFVLDMGEPVNIAYLAELMIRLSGKVPGRDIAIQFVGLRPGEKLKEELFYEKERLEATGHPKIMRALHQCDGRLDVARFVEQAADACVRFDDQKCRSLLESVVPELGTARAAADNVVPLSRRS